MKKALETIIGIVTLIGSPLISPSLQAEEVASAQFLKLGAGARAAAMGDAFTSVSDDVTAGYWNPAGLRQLKSGEAAFMQNNWLVNTQYQYAAGAVPLKNQTVALSLYRVDYGSIERYTAGDVRDGNFNAGSFAGSLSLASSINESVSWGFSVKYLQETLDSVQADGIAADVGVLAHAGKTSFGASLQNLGPQIQYEEEKESLPRTLRLGVSQRALNDRLIAAVDLSKPIDNDTALHAGVEYKVTQFLALRGGYQTTPGNSLDVSGLTNVTGGVGININQFSLDAAFVPYGDLGNTFKFSVLYRFSQPK